MNEEQKDYFGVVTVLRKRAERYERLANYF